MGTSSKLSEEPHVSFDGLARTTSKRLYAMPDTGLIGAVFYTRSASSKAAWKQRAPAYELVSLNLTRRLHQTLQGLNLRKGAWLRLAALALVLYGLLSLLLPHLPTSSTALPRPIFSVPSFQPRSSPSKASSKQLPTPNLIPRLIHQTYQSSTSIPPALQQLRDSWIRMNPTWEARVWDDHECRDFVRREFPQYFDAYMGLPKDVERADFFRYLVVLRYGGVYADIDTECKVPLDEVIRPTDTLVVGWEAEVADDQEAVRRHFSRKRQIQQWAFAGAPEHPALREICDHILQNYQRQFSKFTNMDTLERTGPGAWTDVVLRTALEHPPSRAEDPWHVRILPLVATGVHPKGTAGISPKSPGIVVQHYFSGSWKKQGGYQRLTIFRRLATLLRRAVPAAEAAHAPAAPAVYDPGVTHYPVAINHDPVFSMMVDLIGAGDVQSREDPAATLTRYGNWQAGVDPTRGPSAISALIGSLGDASRPSLFLDVGAGLGFYSLSAAARGHRVVATELAPASLSSLRASLSYNGLAGLVSVHNVTVGAARGRACTQPLGRDTHAWNREDVARGYAHPSLHADVSPAACAASAPRVLLQDLVPPGETVGALRVSAGGWSAAVLEGSLPWLAESGPGVILVELDASEIARTGYTGLPALLDSLRGAGYADMSHAGRVCEERWESITQEVRGQGRLRREPVALKQPTWCRLDPADYAPVTQRNQQHGSMTSGGVELLLLVRNPALPPSAAAAATAMATAAADSTTTVADSPTVIAASAQR